MGESPHLDGGAGREGAKILLLEALPALHSSRAPIIPGLPWEASTSLPAVLLRLETPGAPALLCG
jgi:hypothetical protein